MSLAGIGDVAADHDVVDIADAVRADGDRAQAVRHDVGHAPGGGGWRGRGRRLRRRRSVNRGTASPIGSPTSIAAWMAAPRATTSSTFTPVRGGLPDICETYDRTIGIRVEPPTRSTPSSRGQVRSGLAEGLLGQAARAVHEREGHRLELRPGQLEAPPLGAELEGDPRRRSLGERPLGLLAADQDLVEGHGVVERVEPGLGREPLGEERGDPIVPVLAAEVVVAGRGEDDDLLGRDPRHGDVEGAAAQVVDQDGLVDARPSAARRPGPRRSAR